MDSIMVMHGVRVHVSSVSVVRSEGRIFITKKYIECSCGRIVHSLIVGAESAAPV